VGGPKVGQDEDQSRARDNDKDGDEDGGEGIEVPSIYLSGMNK
jgi:hypothetical protein